MIKKYLVIMAIAISVWIFWVTLEWLLCGDIQFKKSDDVIAWILICSLYINYVLLFEDGEQK